MNSEENEDVLDFNLFLGNESDEDDNLTFSEDILVVNDNEMETETEDYDELNFALLTSIPFSALNIQSLVNFEKDNIFRLTYEEQSVMDRCMNPVLKKLLVLNRCKCLQLKQLYKQLHSILEDCNRDISKLLEEPSDLVSPQALLKTFTWKIGIPYFKDNQFYGAPPNSDVIKKKECKEILMSVYNESRRWSVYDQQILQNAVTDYYFEHKKMQVIEKIRALKRSIDAEDDFKNKMNAEKEIDRFEKNLAQMKRSSFQEVAPLHLDFEVDWYDISTIRLKGKHGAVDCEAFWNIYLNPHINKKPWLPDENKKIKQLTKLYNYQDWDAIAKELNTNRSGYLVCSHYFAHLSDKFKKDRFLPEEDKYLIDVVNNCRLGTYIPWAKVASYFECRSKHQLYHRYKYYLSCKNIKKGTFTEVEDILLTHLVERLGKDFGRITTYIPNRTPIQLRNRYSNYLEKEFIQFGSYTLEEDKKILKYVKENKVKSWGALAAEFNRTRAHLRQRYLTLKKFLKINKDLEKVPRRKQHYLSQCQVGRSETVNKLLDKLRSLENIPTLAEVNKLLKREKSEKITVNQNNSNENPASLLKRRRKANVIDKKLITFFKGTSKYQRARKCATEQQITQSAWRIMKLYEILGANVNNLKTADENHPQLMPVEKEILKSLRQLLNEKTDQSNLKKRSTFIVKTSTNDNHNSVLMDIPTQEIKQVLPPAINNLVGLRCMIIKYNLYKEQFQSYGGPAQQKRGWNNVTYNLASWKTTQYFLRLDQYTKTVIEQERELFMKRLYVLFRWPSLLSVKFPKHLLSEDNNTEQTNDDANKQKQHKKSGRPSKQPNAKILKMNEAKRIKKLMNAPGTATESETNAIVIEQPISDESEGDLDGTDYSDEDPDERRYEQIIANFNMRDMDNDHSLSEMDGPQSSSQESTQTKSNVGLVRVVNIEDLKINQCPNVPLVKHDAMMKLANATTTSNKIVVLGVSNADEDDYIRFNVEEDPLSTDFENENAINIKLNELFDNSQNACDDPKSSSCDNYVLKKVSPNYEDDQSIESPLKKRKRS